MVTRDMVAHGKGWNKLSIPLIDLCNLYGAEVLQIKEKFGGLRFYFTGPEGEGYEYLQALVDAAEAASYHICEECGESGISGYDEETRKPIYKATNKAINGGYWLKTLCDPCREKRHEE